MFFFSQNSGYARSGKCVADWISANTPPTPQGVSTTCKDPSRSTLHCHCGSRRSRGIRMRVLRRSIPPAEKRLFLRVAGNKMECLNSAPPAAVRVLDRRDPSAGRPGMRFRRENQSSISHPLRLTGRFSQVGSPVLLAKVHLTGSQSKLASYT